MKYNRRLNKDQQEKIRKRKKDKKHLKKFEECKCVVCGQPTKYHHRFCKKHYHLSKL